MKRGQRRQINKSIIARDAENHDRRVTLLPGMVIEIVQPPRRSSVTHSVVVAFGLFPGEIGKAVMLFATELAVFRCSSVVEV